MLIASVANKYVEEQPLQTASKENTFTVGELLKKARERHSITLTQASDKLRLAPYVIQAIEENRTSDIPQNQAYLRCFVRAYAKILELDPVAIDQQFKEELPIQKQEELLFPVERINKTSPKKWIFFFSIITSILVSLVSFYLIQQTQVLSTRNMPEISFLLPAPALRKLTPLPSYQVLFLHFLKTGKTGFTEKEPKMSYSTIQHHLPKPVRLVAKKAPYIQLTTQVRTLSVKPLTSAHFFSLPKAGKKSLLLTWTAQRLQLAKVLLKKGDGDFSKQCSYRSTSQVKESGAYLKTNPLRGYLRSFSNQQSCLTSNS